MKKIYTRLLVAMLFLGCTPLFAQYYPGGFPKSNINLWFDASDTTTFTKSAGLITAWKDKSNSLSASQSTNSAQPVLSTISGYSQIEFNGLQGLNIPYNSLLLPTNGYIVAQVNYLFADAPTSATDFRVGTYSCNGAATTGSPALSMRYSTSNSKYVPGDNANNHIMSQFNDLRGQRTMLENYTSGSSGKATWLYNGTGFQTETFSSVTNSTTEATIGNRCFGGTGISNAYYSAIHWGISETVLAGYNAGASGRTILEHYLAAKWGMLDTMKNYTGVNYYYPDNSLFVNDLVGIGMQGAGDTTNSTGSNNGLGFQNISGVTGFLREAGDYLMAADNNLTGTVPVGSGGFTRWNRAWYLNKTDGGYGGLVKVFFDFTNYNLVSSLDTVNNNYYLLYNATNGYYNSDSNYLVPVNSYQINSGTKQLAFLLDANSIANGYYTIVYAPKGSLTSTIPNIGTLTIPSISITTPPNISSVYASNTFNYIVIDPSAITYSVAYYKIYVSVNGGATTVLDSTVGTPTYYPHYNLTNGSTYTYTISAVFAPGKESVQSSPLSGTPNSNSPIWLVAPQYSDSKKVFMAGTAPLSGLPLQFYFDNVSGGGHASGYTTASNYTDSGLTNGNTYSYRYKLRDTIKGVETGWSATLSVLLVDSARGGFTYNMTYLDPTTIYAPYGIGPSTYEPATEDMTNLRYLKHAPAIGVHPRVYCNPEDSTDIRTRLKTTYSGKCAAKWIHAYTILLQLGYSGYNRNAWYAFDTLGNAYFSNVGANDCKALYDSLAAGDIGTTYNYSNLWGGNNAKMAYMFSKEAMECWLYRNQWDSVTNTYYSTRAQKLAKAITVWATKALADPTVSSKNLMAFGSLHMGLTYDFLFDQMSKGQQDTVRAALIKILPDSSFEHGFQAPSYSMTSNWATFGQEIVTNISVEGETGYATKDSGLLRNWVRSVWNFATYGMYDKTGDMYEGIGKNRINSSLLIALAKRGYSILGHPSIRSYATKYLPAVTQPFGFSWVGTDILGGTGYQSPSTGGWNPGWMDIGGLKWVFNADTAVDFLWKNLMQRQYASAPYNQALTPNFYDYADNVSDNYGAGFNTQVPALLFASDYMSMPFSTHEQAALGYNKFYFDSLGGQAVMRTGFDSTSTMVFFANRQDGGGHTYANKNEVLLSALGRIWMPRVTTTASGQTTFDPVSTMQNSSAVLVNDIGVSADTGSNWSTGIVEGKMIYYNNDPKMFTIAGDATKAYSYQWKGSGYGGIAGDNPALNPPTVTKLLDNQNQYRYSPFYNYDNIDFYDRYELTDNTTPPYYYQRTVQRVYTNGIMKKVFRTVSLVQATNPYVFVVDDIQRDNNTNNYKWISPIAPDLSIDTTYTNLSNGNYKFDVVLKEPATTGTRRLLIRVLNVNGSTSNTVAGVLDSAIWSATNSCPGCGLLRFKIESNSIDPQFKVMLFPFHKGDSLPTTTWSSDKSKVYVTNAGVTNTVSFSLDSAGRTNILLNSPDTGIIWTGAIDTLWNKGGNWSTGNVPTATDNVVIPSTGITNFPDIESYFANAKKVSIQSGATLRVDSVLQMAGDMTMLGNVVGLGTLKTSSNSTTPFTAGVSWNVNVEYNKSTGGQTIVGGTYTGLSINASTPGSTSSVYANIVVNGTLNVASGNTLNMTTYSMTGSTTTSTGTGTIQTQSTANPCLPVGATWAGHVMFNATYGGQYLPAGTYQDLNINTSNYGTITATGNVSVTDTFNLSIKSTVDFGTYQFGGTLHKVTGSGTLRTANTSATGALPANGLWAGNVVYYSSSTQTISPGTYASLDMSGSSNGNRILGGSTYPTGTINLSGALVTTTGTVTPNQTTVVFSGNQQTVPAMQFYNLDLTGGFATAFVNGNVSVSNVFTPASITGAGGLGTIVFNGTGAQTVPSFSYNSLTITGSRSASVTLPASLSLTGNLSVGGVTFTSGSLALSSTPVTFSGTTTQTFDVNTTYPYGNITVSNTTSSVSALADLTLSSSTLTVASGATLDMGTYQLLGSFTLSNAGTIKTQNTGTTPIPSSLTYGGTVKYYSTTGTQNIVATSYNNLDISGGTTGGRVLPNGGTVTITGNYTPNTSGTLTNTGSTVVFSGANAQSIASATSFANLQINKSNTANPVTTNGAVSVSSNLTLAKGRILTSASSVLTLASTGTLTGGSNAAYIDGPFLRAIVSGGGLTYAYPVGNYQSSTDYYFPDTLTSATASGNVTITAFAGTTGGTPDATLTSLGTDGYWKITSSVANTISNTFTPYSIGSNGVIGQSTTATGTYTSKGGLLSGGSIYTAALSQPIATDEYYVAAIANVPAPTISTVSSDVPGAGTYYPGSIVTITGTGLSSPTSVTVGGQTATVTSNNGTTMVITVPTGGVSGVISVTTNGGTANYSGTYIANGFVSITSGDWATASTWFSNAVPTLASSVIIKSSHAVTLSTTINTTSTYKAPANLTINTGGTLSIGAGSSTAAGNLTITNSLLNSGTLNVGGDTYSGQLTVSGTFINTGTVTEGSSTQNVSASITLNGAITNSGTITVNYFSTNDNLYVGNTLSNTGTITVNGNLLLNNSNSAITGNGIIYGTNANLYYNTGTHINTGSEWLTGSSTIGSAGVPKNVTIGNTTGSTIIDFGTTTSYHQVVGSLTISNATTGNGLVLGSQSGGDLYLSGNLSATQVSTNAYNNLGGGLQCNGRMILFNGANGTNSAISGPATGTPLNFDYITIGTSSSSTNYVNVGCNLSISAPNGGAPVICSGTIQNTNYNLNLNNSNGTTYTLTLGTLGQSCTGYVYVRAGGSNTANITINGNGTGNLTINNDAGGGNANLNNLTINNANVLLAATLTIKGTFVINSGSFDAQNNALYPNGTTTIGGTLTFSATGTRTFTGLVTINSGGTWNNSGNSNFTFNGGITNNGTFTGGASGNYTFGTNNQALAGSINIPTLTVTGVIVSNTNTLSVSNSLAGTGSMVQLTNSTLNIGGAATTITSLDATTNTPNTVNYNGTGTQTVYGINYYNLGISGSGTKTILATTTNVGGNLSVSGTATGIISVALTITGSLQTALGSTFDLSTFTATYASLSNLGTLKTANTSATPIPSNVVYGGTVTYYSSSSQTIVYASYNNLTASGGARVLDATGTINIAGTYTPGSSTTATGTTVNFNGSSSSIASAANFNNVSIAASSTLTGPTGASISIAGNWSNNGTFTPNNSTVTLVGTNQTITGSTTFYNLTKTVSTAYTLTFPSGQTQSITGTLTLTGTSGNLLTISASTPGTQAIINPSGTRSISFVYVSDNNNTNTTAISATNCYNGGNNTNWSFGPTTYTWTGAANTNWNNVANWTPAAIPSSIDFVTIAKTGSNDLSLEVSPTVGSFTVNSGNTIAFNYKTFTDAGNFTNNGTVNGSSSSLVFSGTTTLSGSGTNNFGNVTINNGSSLSVGSTSLFVSGSWTNNGTFTSGTGTVNFVSTTTGNTIAGNTTGSSQFYNVAFNGTGGAWALPTNMDVAGAFTITAGTVTAPSGTLNLKGTFTNTSGSTAFVHNNGTVNFTGTASLASATGTVTTTFYNLSTSGTATVTTGGSTFNVNNNLTIGDGTAMTLSNTAITVSGTTTIGGGISGTLTVSSSAGAKVFTGDVTINAGGTLNNSGGSSNITLYGNLTLAPTGIFIGNASSTTTLSATSAKSITGTFTGTNKFNNLTINGVGGSWTLPSNMDIGGIFTLTNATVTAPSGNLNLSGNFVNNGTFSHNNGTVTFAGSTTLSGTATSLNNVTINTSSSLTHSVTLNIAGNLLNNGTISGSAATANFNGASTLSGSGAFNFNSLSIAAASSMTSSPGTITISGSYTNNGTFIHNNGTINFTAGAGSTLSGNMTAATNGAFNVVNFNGTNNYNFNSSADVLGTLTIAATQTLKAPSTTLSLSGNFVNNGTFTHNSGTVNFKGTTVISGTSTNTFNNVSIAASSTLTAATSSTINVVGSWTNAGSFVPSSGTVVLTGTSQTLTGSTTFYNLTKTVSSAATLTLPGGATQTVTGTLTLSGALSNILTIASSTAPSVAFINPTASSVNYTFISNITNSNATVVATTNSSNGGNNTNITFGTFVWTGATDTKWTTVSNWSTGYLPGIADAVTIAKTGSNDLSFDANETVGSITINATNNVTISANSYTFTVSGNWTNNGSFSATNGTVVINGTCAMSGANTFKNLTINGAVTASTSPNISATLQINSGGSWSGSAPIYGASSSLAYNTGTTTTVGAEWTAGIASGTGVPQSVTIGSASPNNTVLTFGTSSSYYQVTNSLTISSSGTGHGLILSSVSGGDLKLGGSFTASNASAYNNATSNNNNGTPGGFDGNGRTVYFTGGTPTVTGPSATPLIIPYVNIASGVSNVVLGADLTISAPSGGNAVTSTGTTTNSGPYFSVNGKNLTIGTAGQSASCLSSASGNVLYMKDISGGTKGTLTINGNGGTINPSMDNGGSSYNLSTLTINHPGVTLLVGMVLNNNLNITSGTLTVQNTLTVKGNVTINSGATIVSSASNTINVAGIWSNSGTFTPNTGTVNLNGTSQSMVGSTTFYNLTKSVAAAATLTFPSGQTQFVSGTLTLNGALGNLLSLNASTPGTQALINPSGTRSITYVTVTDNNNANATAIVATNSYNYGNNTNWNFGSSTYTWTGASDTKWNNVANWTPNGIPGSLDLVTIAKTGSNNLSIDISPSIATLTINSGNTVALNSQTLTLTGNLVNNGSLNAASGSLVFAGATTLSGSGTNNWGNVTINGSSSLTAPSGATINVAGNWMNSGTFTPSTSTVLFNGTTQQIGASSFYGLTISTGTSTATGNLAATNALNVSSGATLNMATNQLTSVGTISGTGALQTQSTNSASLPSGKTWTFPVSYNNLTGGQSIQTGTYSTGLTIGNTSGTSTALGNLVVNGNFVTTAGGTFDLAAYTLTTTGTLNTTNTAGTLRIGNIGTSSYQIPINQTWGGSVVYYYTSGNNRIVPGTYNNLDLDGGTANFVNFDYGANPSGVFNIGGTLSTVSTSFTVRNTTFNFTGTNQVVPAISFYNLTLSGTATTFANGNINIANNFNPGSITGATQGTITFNGTSTQTIPAFNYNNLTIAGTRGGGSGITGSTFTGSTIIYNPSLTSNVGVGATITGTGVSSTITNVVTNALVSPTGSVYTNNNAILTNISNTGVVSNMAVAVGGVFSGLYVSGSNGAVSTATGTWANSANTMTVSSNSGLVVGMTVTGGTGLPANTTITNISGTTLTLSNTTTAAQSTSAALNFSAIITLSGTVSAGSTSFTFAPSYTMASPATATGSISNIAVTTSLTLGAGTVGVAGTLSDSHTGTISTITTTGDTLLIGSTQTYSPTTEFQTALNVLGTSAGTVTMGTNLTVNGLYLTGGTLAVAAKTLTINGNASVTSGTLTSSTAGTVIYNQSSAGQTVIPGNYGNLTFSNFNKTLPSSGTVGVATLFTPGTATGHTITGSTFDFNGTTAQTVPAFSYNNLTISGIRTTTSVTLANGTINVAGNYNRTATFTTGSLVVAGNTLNFNGAANQSITAATTETFNNLTINNGTATNLVSLNTSNYSVTGTLTLTSGLLSLGSSSLTLATVSGASSSSYILTGGTGNVIKSIASSGSFTYPIGTSAAYTPLTVGSSSGASTYTVSVSPTISHTVPVAINVANLQWTVLSSATASATLTYQFNAANGASNFSPTATCELGIYNSSYTVSSLGIPTSLGSGVYTASKSSVSFTSATTYNYVIGNTGAISNSCTTGTYVGLNGGDANNANNWCLATLPTSSTNVVISTNTPKLTSNLSVNGITLNSGFNLNGNTLTINGTISGTGTLTGSTTSSINVASSGSGTLYLDQTTPGTTNTLNNLTINTSGMVTLGNSVNIVGFLYPTSGSLALGNNNITLKSTAIGTSAQVGTVGATITYSGTGRFIAERFLNNSRRGYRNISSNGILSDSAIFNNWQENGATIAGYGTQITGSVKNSAGYNPTTGLDYTRTGNPSLFTYNNSDAFVAVTNTISPVLNQLIPFVGYYALIRGDRTYDLFSNGPSLTVASTTLRTKGKLVYGQVKLSSNANPIWAFSGSVTSTFQLNKNTVPNGGSVNNYGFSLIANPYNCTVNWNTVYARSSTLSNSHLSKYYWVWNQGLNNGLGAYITVDNSGTASTSTGSLTTTNTNWLQPGQSFFVQNDHTGNDIVVDFEESDKYVTDNTKLVGVFGSSQPNMLRFSLNKQSVADTIITDGAVLEVDASFNNAIDLNDAGKFENPTENISIHREGVDLSIENRRLPTVNDTIPLQIWNVSVDSSYILKVDATQFASSLQPYLYDNLLNTKTALATTTPTQVTFKPSTDTLGYKHRFSIVFSNTVVLPISFVSISAQHASTGNVVEWQSTCGNGATWYVIERSTDGTTFDIVGQVSAKTAGCLQSYSFKDVNNVSGKLYYRVHLIGNGVDLYSGVAEVTVAASIGNVSIYPTVLNDNHCTVHLEDMAKGRYQVVLFDEKGSKVSEQSFQHDGATASHSISLIGKLALGIYEVQIIGGDKLLLTQKVVVE